MSKSNRQAASDECPMCSRIGRGPLCKAHHGAELVIDGKRIDKIELNTTPALFGGADRWTLTIWSGMSMLVESEFMTLAGALGWVNERVIGGCDGKI